VTKVNEVTISGEQIKLISIRNPWGNEVEWNGAWSDKSYEWQSVDQATKTEIGLVCENDGESWMSYNDFMYNWDCVDICHVTIDGFSAELLETDYDADLSWSCSYYLSEWSGSSAGGCANSPSFWSNPQFFVKLSDVDKDDNENMATMIVELMQQDHRHKFNENRGDFSQEYIGYRVFSVKENVPLDERQSSGQRFKANDLTLIGNSGSFINKRQIAKRFRVVPGNYVIIPSTFEKDHESKFKISMLTECLIETSGK